MNATSLTDFFQVVLRLCMERVSILLLVECSSSAIHFCINSELFKFLGDQVAHEAFSLSCQFLEVLFGLSAFVLNCCKLVHENNWFLLAWQRERGRVLPYKLVAQDVLEFSLK